MEKNRLFAWRGLFFFVLLGTLFSVDLSIIGMQDEKVEERFWLLVSLQLSGEASAEEEAELAELLRAHPSWGLRKEIFTNIWKGRAGVSFPEAGVAGGMGVPAGRDVFSRHLQRLSNHLAGRAAQIEPGNSAGGDLGNAKAEQGNSELAPLEPTNPGSAKLSPSRTAAVRRISKNRLAIGVAAAVLAALALVWLLVQINHKPAEQGYNTVSTRPGSPSKIQLPDGSLVWLNADSRLTYRNADQGATREVQLTGEAYFEVAHDPVHPFLIHTATIDIRVLGTSFNVQCYGNERTTETSLFQGSVEVTLRSSPDKKIVLKPNEKLIVHNNQMAVSGPAISHPD